MMPHKWSWLYKLENNVIKFNKDHMYFCRICGEKGIKYYIYSKTISDTEFCEEFLLKQVLL